MVKIRIIISIITLFFCVVGCQLSFFKKDQMTKGTPEALYSRGALEYQNGNYKKAREYFIRVREEYPLSDLAILAEMGIADSHFSDKEYIEAEDAYNDFVTLHPTNENVPYAIYQAGMCNFLQIEAIDRDQTQTAKARKEFEKLISRYPESKFSIMAERLLLECKQKQGEHEFYVAKFYYTQNEYRAALLRLEKITKEFANIGLDSKVEFLLNKTKMKLAEKEKVKNGKDAKEIAVEQPAPPKEVAAVPTPKVKEQDTYIVVPKEEAVAAPVITDNNLAKVNKEQDVRNHVNKWLNSWRSGDMNTYRDCYESGFSAKGMNLNSWITYKTNVRKKSKNINISIDDLQISSDENNAIALFTQNYSSSILQDICRKKLELRKINGDWKIYKEELIMENKGNKEKKKKA